MIFLEQHLSHLSTVDHDLHQVEPLIDHNRVQERLLEPPLQKPSSTRGPGLVVDGVAGGVGGGEHVEAGHGPGGGG